MSSVRIAYPRSDQVHLLVYKLPKMNHERMRRLMNRFEALLEKYDGTGSSSYWLENEDPILRGLKSFPTTFALKSDEEIWLQVIQYRSREHRDLVLGQITKDPELYQLFGKFADLISHDFTIRMGEFEKIEVRASPKSPQSDHSGRKS